MVQDLKEALDGGYIEQQQFDRAQEEIQIVKNNYERISYIMLLLNKPNRKDKKGREESVNKKWYDALKGSSREALMDENRDALVDFKKIIEEIKDDNK